MPDSLTKFTILAVDDSASNIDVLVDLLAETYDVLVALDGHTALEMVAEERIDLILLDIMMPGMSGFNVCRHLKNSESSRDIPVIFLTAKTDETSIETAYDVGGIDYVTKPFKQIELLARIRTQLQLRTLVTKLAYLANHDSLSGILNRRAFFERAIALFAQKREVCAAMIDIDDFKSINDRYGHAAGDEVIRRTVAIIAQHLPEHCLLGRLGGEEFAIVIAGLARDSFFCLVERMREAVAKLSVEHDDAPGGLQFEISCGVAVKSPATKTVDGLLHAADQALYRAKSGGKNRTVWIDVRAESA